MADGTPEEALAHVTRLSQKPGVQSTLILSRDTGAIVRTSGLISKSSNPNPNSVLPSSADDSLGTGYSNGTDTRGSSGGLQSAEDVARLVFKFVEAAGEFAEGLEPGAGDDDVKLVRLRTRKNELVIVPSAKFLLVVIHDMPPA